MKATFNKHGIPLDSSDRFTVALAVEQQLTAPVLTDTWRHPKGVEGRVCKIEESSVGVKGMWEWKVPREMELKGRSMHRLNTFTELKYSWSVESPGQAISITAADDNSLHVLINDDPLELHSYLPGYHFSRIVHYLLSLEIMLHTECST